MLGEIAPLIHLCSMAIFHLLVTRHREPKMIHGEERFPALGESLEPITERGRGIWAGGRRGELTHPSALSENKKRSPSLLEMRYEMPPLAW